MSNGSKQDTRDRLDRLETARKKNMALYTRYLNVLENVIQKPTYDKAKVNQASQKTGTYALNVRELDKEITDLKRKLGK
jgi:Spy/CpxP family protein refolding chaperone